MARQRDGLEVPMDDMNEEMDSAKGESSANSNRTGAVLLGGRLMKSVSVPTFTVETIPD